LCWIAPATDFSVKRHLCVGTDFVEHSITYTLTALRKCVGNLKLEHASKRRRGLSVEAALALADF